MTKEESKKRVINYLEKTSKHLFELKKTQFNSDRVLLKVFKDSDGNFKVLDGDRIRDINIDRMVDWYGGNAENVISNSLFVRREARAIRQRKYREDIQEKINKLSE